MRLTPDAISCIQSAVAQVVSLLVRTQHTDDGWVFHAANTDTHQRDESSFNAPTLKTETRTQSGVDSRIIEMLFEGRLHR